MIDIVLELDIYLVGQRCQLPARDREEAHPGAGLVEWDVDRKTLHVFLVT